MKMKNSIVFDHMICSIEEKYLSSYAHYMEPLRHSNYQQLRDPHGF